MVKFFLIVNPIRSSAELILEYSFTGEFAFGSFFVHTKLLQNF